MAKTKKAKLTQYPDGSGQHTIDVIFHKFGNKLIPLDNGLYVTETIAIVENTDGTLEKVSINRVKFV